jgi:hypothetical protein
MATNFSTMTLAEIRAYAQNALVDATKLCPKAYSLYATAYSHTLDWTKPEAGLGSLRLELDAADSACHSEAYGPGGVKYSAGAGGSTSAGGSANLVIAESTTPIWVWLLALGGAGIGLWLLFGKGRKGRKR